MAGPSRTCIGCGVAIARKGTRGRHPIRCEECRRAHRVDALRAQDWRERRRPTVPCAVCGSLMWQDNRFPLDEQPPGRTCQPCRRAQRDARSKSGASRNIFTCEACGKTWRRPPTRGQVPRWCSLRCARRTYARRREGRTRAAWVEEVHLAQLAERDGWNCGICGRKVDRSLAHPDPMSASLDHIVPLAAGGLHERANAQLAHLRCNSVKGARATGNQLLLFG